MDNRGKGSEGESQADRKDLPNKFIWGVNSVAEGTSYTRVVDEFDSLTPY